MYLPLRSITLTGTVTRVVLTRTTSPSTVSGTPGSGVGSFSIVASEADVPEEDEVAEPRLPLLSRVTGLRPDCAKRACAIVRFSKRHIATVDIDSRIPGIVNQ